MATGKKALNEARKNGVGVTIDYTKLHTEMGKLKKQLEAVRDRRKSRGMSIHRVLFVLVALKALKIATSCQVNMLEGF